MTTNNPASGNVIALSKSRIGSADAIKARIAEWCEWFDLDMPSLRTRKGQILLTDPLADWLKSSGASYDWIFLGDAKGLAIGYRNEHTKAEPIVRLTAALDPVEQNMLLTALRLVGSGEVSIDDAMQTFRTAVEERRDALAKAVTA